MLAAASFVPKKGPYSVKLHGPFVIFLPLSVPVVLSAAKRRPSEFSPVDPRVAQRRIGQRGVLGANIKRVN